MGKNFILFEILFTSLHLYCGIWGHSEQPHAHISFLRDSQSPLGLDQSSSRFEVQTLQTVLPLSLCSQSPSRWHLWCKEQEIATSQSSAVYATMINKYVSPSVKIYLITITIYLFVIEDWEMRSILFNRGTDHSPGPADCNWMVKNLKVYISFITHEWWFSASVRCNSTMLNYYECNVPSIYVLERCSYYEKKLWAWKIPRDRWKEVEMI